MVLDRFSKRTTETSGKKRKGTIRIRSTKYTVAKQLNDTYKYVN